MSTELTVFAFSPNPEWGLPSTGPFALKLIAWLRVADIDFELKHEDNTMKGPKGKNPWIEIDGRAMGDSELIIEFLSERYGVDLEEGLTAEQTGRGVAIRRMVEEHLHQVFEYELIVAPAGFERFSAMIASLMPPVIGTLLGLYLRRHFHRQLTARGIARHQPDDIARMGIADIDALDALLGEREWFVADRPTLTDCSVFGLLSPVVCSGLPTPVCTYARSRPALVAWVERMRARVEAGPVDAEGDVPRLRAV